MIVVRYFTRRLIGVLIRVGRTLRGQERPGRAETTTGASEAGNGPQIAEQETRR